MEKIVEKCLRCRNKCKVKSEVCAILISCRNYLSKRSLSLEKKKDKGNIPPANNR